MKAEELMIGDKVYWGDNVVMFVWDIRRTDKTIIGSVDEKFIPEELQYFFADFAGLSKGFVSVDPSDLKPIPLTPDILERNGFKFDGIANWRLRDGEGLFIKVCPVMLNNSDWLPGFEVNKHIDSISLIGKEQVYVHQLQHALTQVDVEINLEI